MKKVCIIVLGMHRSGTSCLIGSLEKLGVYLGDISTWNPHNTKGNRESDAIVSLNEELFSYNGASWDNPPKELKYTAQQASKRDAIIKQYMDSDEQIIGFKDPRTMFTLEFWQEGLKENYEVRYVATFRSPFAVADSLHRRNKFSTQKSILIWQSYNENLVKYYDKHHFPIICFDKIGVEYLNDLKDIVEKLGLDSTKLDKDLFFDDLLRVSSSEPTENSKSIDSENLYKKLKLLSKRK